MLEPFSLGKKSLEGDRINIDRVMKIVGEYAAIIHQIPQLKLTG